MTRALGLGGCHGGGVAGGGFAWFGGGVFAGALGLELLGVEGAVAAEGSDGEGLGVVLEGVGWWFGAFVVDLDVLALLGEGEDGVGAVADYGAGEDVAGYAEVARVGDGAHGLELGDGDVVLLGVLCARVGEPADGRDDDEAGDDELYGRLGTLCLHEYSLSLSGLLGAVMGVTGVN